MEFLICTHGPNENTLKTIETTQSILKQPKSTSCNESRVQPSQKNENHDTIWQW